MNKRMSSVLKQGDNTPVVLNSVRQEMIFEGMQVEIIEINGEPYFELYSTGMALGQVRTNSAGKPYPRKDRIDENIENAKIEVCVHNGHKYINEEQLYDLMLEMKTDKVKPFRKWVTSKVLPSIRKHGAYMTDNVLEQAIENPDFAIGLLTKLKEEKEARKNLELENAQQKQIIGELQPKATYYDLILQSNQLMPISLIAKDYGMGAQTLNKKLHDLGVQYNQSGTWLLYAKYQDKGYTQSKTQSYPKSDGNIGTKLHTQWTQKGRLFIYELLKQQGVLPTIEREENA